MKRIIVLFALLLGSIISIAQPVTQRGTSAVTVQDSRLFAEFNFRPPAFPDTIRANQQIGLDSCGALIFSRDINAYYYRACSPKRWVRVASGGATADSAYLSYRPLTDSTFLLCRVGGTRCDTIKVNGKGVTQAWLLGGNLNPVSNNLGTTSTTDVVIITNDVARMKIAGNGINRSSAARNRYLMIDTLTRYLFYGDESDTTAWKLAGNSNAIAGSSFVGTTNNVPLEFRVNNKKSGYLDSTYKTTSLGYGSLRDVTPSGTTTGNHNVSIGYKSMNKDTTGRENTSIGSQSLLNSSGSIGNISAGYGAMGLSRQVFYNIGIGWGALSKNYYGQFNTAVGHNTAGGLVPLVGDTINNNTYIGAFAGYSQRAGRNNVMIGDSAGRENITGSRNVFIGSAAGKNEGGSDKLYISNSNISNPLIKGNFADSTLNVNGKMSISLTSQTPDSSLDVTGGVKLRTIYRSSALTDSMLLVGADGGVVKREVIVPSNTNVTRIISGSAVWDSLLVYSVTKCWYYINGILYSSAPTNVTLATADSSNPRIDVIYCDTLGNVGVITGIPSPDPVKPTVNPLSQIELTHINVNAQGTTPAGVSQRIIYNENVGVPNEWNTSTDVPASGVDFAYTVNPYVGVKSAFAPAYNSNYSLIFTNNAFVNADTLSELSMYLRQNSAPPAARAGTTMFSIILLKSGVQITKPVLVSDGLYGYSVLTLNSYQHLAVPFSDFLFKNALDKTFDQIQIEIEFLFVPKLGYQFDYITASTGGTPPAVTSDYWTLSGNDNTSFPNAKLGTTSKDQLSIVTDDIERINITNAGVISIPQLQTTTDTLLYKPLVINPINGQVANIGNWGNNTVYTENPIMSRTSGDSNIIYFNPDTANVWRGGGGDTPTLAQVLTKGNVINDGQQIVIKSFFDNDGSLDGSGLIYADSNATTYSKIDKDGLYMQGSAYLPSINTYINGNISTAVGLNRGTEYNSEYGTYNITIPPIWSSNDLYYPPNNVNGVGQDTIATLADVRAGGGGGIPTLQQVLDNNHALVNDINLQGTNSGINQTGTSLNAFGLNAAEEQSGVAINAFGEYAASFNSGNGINALGISAGQYNTGADNNLLGNQAGLNNQGNNINGLGLYSANGNSGNNVNAFGKESGLANTFNDVNLFGKLSSATANNQIVFTTDDGVYQTRLQQNNTQDNLINIPNESGTLLLDAPSDGNLYGRKDNAWEVVSGGGGGGTVTSVDLTMPSAFNVTGNPVTNIGTLAVTGAGTVSQYIRGDGSLANFPTASGGGASVSYYLNGSVSQGTIGGVAYKQMNSVPVVGAGTDFTINADGYIAQFITDVADPNKLLIPAGNWNFETYFSASSAGGSPSFYIELYKYNGTTFTLIASNSATPENITGGTNIDLYFTALAVPSTTLLATDRLAVRFFVTHSGRTITMHTENSHLSQIITTFSTGLTALNGLTAQVQSFSTGTSGTDFGISSSTATHTFNLPDASASNRGALTSANWTTFNNKIGAADTSVFQRKSIASYSLMANNTNATGNATAQTFRDTAGTYAGTIAWNGTAPTTQTINTYQWQQTGKMVRLQLYGYYTNAGAGCSTVSLTIPADCPAPDISMFTSGALAVLYQGIGGLGLSNVSLTTTTNAYMRRNAANNGNELLISAASANYRRYQIDITYRAQ